MNKSVRNILILIFVVISFIIILFLLLHFDIIKIDNKRTLDISNYDKDDDIEMVSADIGYKESGDSFMIYNKNGDLITTVRDFDEIEFYVKNPDVNPTGGIYQEASQDGVEEENIEE